MWILYSVTDEDSESDQEEPEEQDKKNSVCSHMIVT